MDIDQAYLPLVILPQTNTTGKIHFWQTSSLPPPPPHHHHRHHQYHYHDHYYNYNYNYYYYYYYFLQLLKTRLQKSIGPDQIPNWILKDLDGIIATPICHLFNSSL